MKYSMTYQMIIHDIYLKPSIPQSDLSIRLFKIKDHWLQVVIYNYFTLQTNKIIFELITE